MLEFSKYNKIAGIYKWENKINHKCYIGQSIDLGSRLRHHVNNYKHRRYNAPLYRAFDKYGIDSFDVEILYQFENPFNEIKQFLDRLEIACIEQYNSYGKTGYNQTRGGDAGILGYKFTEEQCQKVSESAKKAAAKQRREVFIYDMKTKREYCFQSITNAAKYFNCHHSQMTRICRWQQLTINKSLVGSMSKDTLMKRVEYVKEYSIGFGKTRKRPTPGLKRHFNTPTGKKIISKEQKLKISQGLLRYNERKQAAKQNFQLYNGD